MIVDWLLHHSFAFIDWIMSFIPADLASVDLLNDILLYIARVYARGGDIFFLFVPEAAFKTAVDILFFWLIHTPGWAAIMWVLRKIPFLAIE